jgi:acyl-CoA synthetase (AMP-forming)/AMP-acid ligase II
VITGRSKDIIIRSGENISPKEVEDLLVGHPAVAEAAIVAMPSATTGEKGCAFILPRPGQSIDMPEIKRFLDEAGLARQKFPEHLVLVDDLPRVPSGKVRKDVLRTRAREIAAELA